MEIDLDIDTDRFNFNKIEKNEKTKNLIFDLDGTLVTYNKKYRLDWDIPIYVMQWLEKNKGAKIIIVSNQKNYNEEMSKKIKNIIRKLREYMIVDIYISTGDNWFRKPSPRIFQDYILKPNTEYIYIGDAAGRPGDFSNSDRLFAYNSNIIAETKNSQVKFETPEVFFGLTDPKTEKLPNLENMFVFTNFTNTKNNKEIVEKITQYLNKHKKNIVILSGLPGSGKSSFTDYLLSYLEVNYSELYGEEAKKIVVTTDKCDVHITTPIFVGHTLTKKKQSEISEYDLIFWDTTGYSKTKRRTIMENFPDHTPSIIYMKADEKLRKWLRFYRTYETNITVPEIALRSQEKNFEEPDISEFNDLKSESEISNLKTNKEKEKVEKNELFVINTLNFIQPSDLGIEGKFLV